MLPFQIKIVVFYKTSPVVYEIVSISKFTFSRYCCLAFNPLVLIFSEIILTIVNLIEEILY